MRALESHARARVERARARLATGTARLDTLSPLAVLGRGYAIVRLAGGGAILRSPDQVTAGDRLRVRLAEGELDATVSALPSGSEGEKS
jgi:exodeoxyribonuclease VII large subunit